MDYEIKAQELIDVLTEQRNSALNELARAQAVLRGLQRKPSNGAGEPHADDERLPAGL